EMSDCLAQQPVLFRVSLFERSQLPNSRLAELVCLGSQAVGFSVVQRPYVGLGGGSDRAQHLLLAAARAGAIAADHRVVVVPDHQHVAQGRGLGILWMLVVVETQVLLWSIRQKVQEASASLVFGVELLGFLDHLQGFVIAAGGHTGSATFT